jgi:hypothetical protein
LLTAAEVLLLLLWTLQFSRPYLDLDPAVVPAGNEYSSNINLHHLWTRARVCGWCALWNGSMGGGLPALADPLGSTLHPLVALATVGWGVPAGAKLSMVGAFLMAGLGQWWLGRVLGLGRIACLWSGALAVVAGNLGPRMQSGAFAVLFSTAACAVVLPPLVAVGLRGTRRAAVILGVSLGLAAVAGQGYMQIGLLGAMLLVPLLLPWGSPRLGVTVQRYALAAGIGALLAAPFLLPLLHALPYFEKQTDPSFRTAQPFRFIPLNLIIDDPKFYASEVLGKTPAVADNATYVGWIPVLLALVALIPGTRGGADWPAPRRVRWFLAATALLEMWLASAAPFIWISLSWPGTWLAQQANGVRYASYIAGLAVPCVLALAAVAVDRLQQGGAPRLWLVLTGAPGGGQPGRSIPLEARWLLLVPLVLALSGAAAFSKQWVRTERVGPELRTVLEALRPPDPQWVSPVFGEHYWIEPATGMGLKLVTSLQLNIQRFAWKGRPSPEPVLAASRGGAPEGMTLAGTVAGLGIYTATGREYAAVTGAGGDRTVCTARANGGDVDVICPAGPAGVLTVKENAWSGWRARVEGRPVPLRPSNWLTVDLPAGGEGERRISFRYRPWDVPLGLLLGATGVALAAYAWWRDGPRAGGQARAPAEGGSAA